MSRTSTAMTLPKAWRWRGLQTGIVDHARVAVAEVAGVEAEAAVAADVGTTVEVAATAVAAGASSLQKSEKKPQRELRLCAVRIVS
jgi:hypothetical protein